MNTILSINNCLKEVVESRIGNRTHRYIAMDEEKGPFLTDVKGDLSLGKLVDAVLKISEKGLKDVNSLEIRKLESNFNNFVILYRKNGFERLNKVSKWLLDRKIEKIFSNITSHLDSMYGTKQKTIVCPIPAEDIIENELVNYKDWFEEQGLVSITKTISYHKIGNKNHPIAGMKELAGRENVELDDFIKAFERELYRKPIFMKEAHCINHVSYLARTILEASLEEEVDSKEFLDRVSALIETKNRETIVFDRATFLKVIGNGVHLPHSVDLKSSEVQALLKDKTWEGNEDRTLTYDVMSETVKIEMLKTIAEMTVTDQFKTALKGLFRG